MAFNFVITAISFIFPKKKYENEKRGNSLDKISDTLISVCDNVTLSSLLIV